MPKRVRRTRRYVRSRKETAAELLISDLVASCDGLKQAFWTGLAAYRKRFEGRRSSEVLPKCQNSRKNRSTWGVFRAWSSQRGKLDRSHTRHLCHTRYLCHLRHLRHLDEKSRGDDDISGLFSFLFGLDSFRAHFSATNFTVTSIKGLHHNFHNVFIITCLGCADSFFGRMDHRCCLKHGFQEDDAGASFNNTFIYGPQGCCCRGTAAPLINCSGI